MHPPRQPHPLLICCYHGNTADRTSGCVIMPEQSENNTASDGEKATGKEAAPEAGGEVATSASKAIPAGIVPLFFSGASQQIFGCVADSDLTVENPHKLIPKQKVVEDFKNRAAISDFHPVKQKLLVKIPF